MEVRGTLRAMDQYFTGSTLKNILFNYSQSEVGMRHPDGPVGVMLRDQGQVDMYAGRSRQIMTLEGFVLNLARCWGLASDQIYLRMPDVQGLKINGKVFSKELHAGQEVAGLRKRIPQNVGFVTSELLINTRTGRIISGFVEASEYLEPRKVFEADLGDDILPTVEERRYTLWAKALGSENI